MVLQTTMPTLKDVMDMTDKDGKIADIIDIVVQQNPMLSDMVVQEGNLATGTRAVIKTGYPAGQFRKLYGFVQPEKSTRKTVTATCGMLESYAQVDKALADLGGNKDAVRMVESDAIVSGMAKTLQYNIIYGDQDVDPEKITGLSPLYSDTTAENGEQIILAGGATPSQNTSAWLVTWGKNTVYGFFPKGSKAGIQVEDRGQQTIRDASGGGYEAYVEHFRWDIGLMVANWKSVARVANIDVPSLATIGEVADTSPNIFMKLVEAYGKIEDTLTQGRTVMYVSKSMITAMRKYLLNKGNMWITKGDFMGRPETLFFYGIPVVPCTEILDTEDVIS